MTDDSVEKYRQDLAIIRDTAAQVMKDFEIFGIDIKFSGDPFCAWGELKSQVAPVLFELFQKDQSRFQSLLYRIDINEKNFRKLLADTSTDFSNNLAELTLQREFQKILTRRFFNS